MGEQKGLLLAGDLMVSFEAANDVWTPWFQVECDKLEISTPSDLKEKLSKSRRAYGQPFFSLPLPKPAEFNITFSEVTRQIFAMQLSGALSTFTRTSTAFEAVEITLPEDGWVEIGYDGVTDVEARQAPTPGVGEGAPPTLGAEYVLDEDYELNPRLGMIRRLPGGAIAADTKVYLYGTEAAVAAGQRIEGARQHKTIMRWKLDGLNLADDSDILLFADRAMVTSNAAYDFLQAEVSEAALTGRLEIPAKGKAPFVLEWK